MKRRQRNVTYGLACVALLGMVAGSLADGPSGQGIRLGAGMISPFVDGNVTYDSNIYDTPADVKSDTFFDGTVGLRGGYTGDALDVSGLGFLNRRSYMD